LLGNVSANNNREAMEVVFTVRSMPRLYKKSAFSLSERILRKDYDRKGSVAKRETLVVSLKRLGAKTK
jgi:hypothetical protein